MTPDNTDNVFSFFRCPATVVSVSAMSSSTSSSSSSSSAESTGGGGSGYSHHYQHHHHGDDTERTPLLRSAVTAREVVAHREALRRQQQRQQKQQQQGPKTSDRPVASSSRPLPVGHQEAGTDIDADGGTTATARETPSEGDLPPSPPSTPPPSRTPGPLQATLPAREIQPLPQNNISRARDRLNAIASADLEAQIAAAPASNDTTNPRSWPSTASSTTAGGIGNWLSRPFARMRRGSSSRDDNDSYERPPSTNFNVDGLSRLLSAVAIALFFVFVSVVFIAMVDGEERKEGKEEVAQPYRSPTFSLSPASRV